MPQLQSRKVRRVCVPGAHCLWATGFECSVVTMIEWIALGPVAAAFALATVLLLLLLVDVLMRRADVTAGLLIGSTLIDAFFARAVASLTLPGDMRVGFTDIIATLVLCAAFGRLLRMRRLNTYQRWLILFMVLLVLS